MHGVIKLQQKNNVATTWKTHAYVLESERINFEYLNCVQEKWCCNIIRQNNIPIGTSASW